MTDLTYTWGTDAEIRRVNTLAAGIEPRLFHWWGDSTTDSLRATLAELDEKLDTLDDSDGFFTDTIRDMRLELAYRTNPR